MAYNMNQLSAMDAKQIAACSPKHIESVIADLIETARVERKLTDNVMQEKRRLHDALCFWLPQNRGDLPDAMQERIAADAYLLVGYDNMPDEKSAEELGWIWATGNKEVEPLVVKCENCEEPVKIANVQRNTLKESSVCGGCGESDPSKRCIGCFHFNQSAQG